jgi:hypothetical protein
MTLVELPQALYSTDEDISYADAERIQNTLYTDFNIEVCLPEGRYAWVEAN